jgi:hypothetical protein
VSRLPPVRGVRARLLLVVVTALAVALGAAIIGFNVLLARDASHDADAAQSRASAELARSVTGNKIRLAANGSDASATAALARGLW